MLRKKGIKRIKRIKRKRNRMNRMNRLSFRLSFRNKKMKELKN